MDNDERIQAVIQHGEAQEDLKEYSRGIQRQREEDIGELHGLIGRIETAEMFGNLATVSRLVWLQRVKDGKLYRNLNDCSTWEAFCKRLGKSRRLIDEQLQNLSMFGGSFLETAQRLNMGYRELRKLRTAITDGNMEIDEGTLIIEDERIPIDVDHKDDLQGALEQLVESKLKLRDELEKEKAERDKLVKAQTKGLEVERDALVKEVQTLKKKIPDGKDYSEWAVDQIKALEDQVTRFAWDCQAMIADPQLEKDHVSQGKIYGMFDAMEAELQDIRKRFDEALPRLY